MNPAHMTRSAGVWTYGQPSFNPPCRAAELEHTSEQQAVLIVDIEGQLLALQAQHAASEQRCAQLQRLGAAYSQVLLVQTLLRGLSDDVPCC